MPPLVVTMDELDRICHAVERGIEATLPVCHGRLGRAMES